MAEHADNVLWWRYGDRESETHLITVNQDKARNSGKYKFLLKEDFAHMRFTDMGLVRDEESSVIKRKGNTKMAGETKVQNKVVTTKKKHKRMGMKELMGP
jgi:hypothetical protein